MGLDCSSEKRKILIERITNLLFFSGVDNKWVMNELHEFSLNMNSFEVLVSVLKHRAVTTYFLRSELHMPKTSVYYALNWLKERGYVVEARPVSVKGTKSVKVYAVPDYTTDDVFTAREKDKLTRTPAYAEVKRVKACMLDEFIFMRITDFKPELGEIYTSKLKEEGRKLVKGVQWRDIEPMVREQLQEEGYKIVVG